MKNIVIVYLYHAQLKRIVPKFKGLVHPKILILSLITDPHDVLNREEFL